MIMNRNLRKILISISLIFVVSMISFGCNAVEQNGGVNGGQLPAPGREAPNFTLNNLNGEEVSLEDLRGNPVMVNFWATWCGYCRLEMPFFQEVYEDPDWTSTGLVILAVNVGESRDQAEGFMKDNGFTFEVLLDSTSNVAMAYNIGGYPTTLFIDKDGIIKRIVAGAFRSVSQIEDRLLELIFDGD